MGGHESDRPILLTTEKSESAAAAEQIYQITQTHIGTGISTQREAPEIACGLPVSRAVYFENKTKEQAYETYYTAILECVKAFDNFDVIGHLDYCKRYYPGEYTQGDHLIAQPLVEEIFRTLIAKGKGIEVNTSGFRHVSEMCMPHYDIIALYRQMGGTRITIGSDSHRDETVGFRVDDTMAQLKQIGFTHISTFEQRVETKLPL